MGGCGLLEWRAKVFESDSIFGANVEAETAVLMKTAGEALEIE